MRKEKSLIIIGFWILILPFLGFPNSWRNFLYVITGLVVMYLGYLFYIEVKASIPKEENEFKPFVDNINNEE